jgi:hypothetical protein
MNDLNLDDCITEKLQKKSSEKCVKKKDVQMKVLETALQE